MEADAIKMVYPRLYLSNKEIDINFFFEMPFKLRLALCKDEEFLSNVLDQIITRPGDCQEWHTWDSSKLGAIFMYAPKLYRYKKRNALRVIRNIDPFALFAVGHKLRNDIQIVYAAIKNDGETLALAPKKFKEHKGIVFAATKNHPRAFKHADQKLKKDKAFVMKLIEENPQIIKYADASLKKDRKIMTKVIKADGWLLKYADKDLKSDKYFVLEAIKNTYPYSRWHEFLIDIDPCLIDSSEILEAIGKFRETCEIPF